MVFPAFGLNKKAFVEKFLVEKKMYYKDIVRMIEEKTSVRYTIYGIMKWSKQVGIYVRQDKTRKAHNFDDKTGKKFSRLTVIGFHGYKHINNGKKRTLWKCRCDCGKIAIVQGNQLSTGNTKSCGCHKSELTRKRNTLLKTKKVHDGFSYVWQGYKKGAKDRGYSFDLTKDEFREFTQQDCYYCGKAPLQRRGTRIKGKMQGFIYNGIDRKDSGKGYIKDNCVSCCRRCNFAKGDRPQEEFLRHIKKIHEHLSL